MGGGPARVTPPVPQRPEPWSPARLFGVRFALLYLVLYGLPPMLAEVPVVGWPARALGDLWERAVIWSGDALFGLDIPPAVANGSGDQQVHWIGAAGLALVAALAALAWSLIDRGRREDRATAEVLRVYLRYLLAFTMLTYGMAKVLKSQFPAPSPVRLLMPIGQTSPMGLLWTLMGYSTFYTVLAGLAEVAGGVLLLFRRTTALGGLVLLGVLGNVVALNYAYDVPVKLFSSHLLLMVLILLAPDARRLVDLLIRNRPVAASDLGEAPLASRWPRAVRTTRLLVIAAMVLFVGHESYTIYRDYGDGRAAGPLEGPYRVIAMERDGVPVAPSDPSGWRQVSIARMTFMTVAGDGSLGRYAISADPAHSRISIVDRSDPTRTGELTTSGSRDQLQLSGQLAGTRLTLRLRAIEESELTLLDRGFHWVSPEPFNR
jgi:hypothetical protein